MNNKKYDMALFRKEEGKCLSINDIERLLKMLKSSEEVATINIAGGHCYAMGFCTGEAFREYENQFLQIKNSVWLELDTADFSSLTGEHKIFGMDVYLK